MGFWGKLGKIVSITMISVGAVGTAGFGALCGIGANYTVVQTQTSGPEGQTVKMEMGVGSLNYGMMWENGVLAPKVNGIYPGRIDETTGKEMTYDQFVSRTEDMLNNKQEDLGGKTGRESYNEQISMLKEQLKNAPTEEAKKAIQEQIDAANEFLSMMEAPQKAKDMMISGAVLTTIFGLVTIAGIPLLILCKKKA